MTATVDSVDARLRALETANRRLFVVVVGLGVLFLAGLGLLLAGQVDADDGVPLPALQARSLDIVNEDGKTVVHLGVRSSGAGGLWLTDAEGRRMLKLNQTVEGTGRIAILDATGREVQVLTAE